MRWSAPVEMKSDVARWSQQREAAQQGRCSNERGVLTEKMVPFRARAFAPSIIQPTVEVAPPAGVVPSGSVVADARS
jgi:hypothetical protein